MAVVGLNEIFGKIVLTERGESGREGVKVSQRRVSGMCSKSYF